MTAQRELCHQCMNGHSWACRGALQSQMQSLQCAAGVVEPVCTGGCGRDGQVICRGCGFASLWRFPSEEEAALGNHGAQSPASMWVASPGHTIGHCKVKCSLCSVQQVWWSLHWGLRQVLAGQVVCGGCGFASSLWRFPEEEAELDTHSAQSPASMWVASPRHAMGYYKVECSLCSVQQVCG